MTSRRAGRAAELRARARRLPQLTLDERETLDLELIATGAASPLVGFLGCRDYRSVLDHLTLAGGTPWPLPFTLAVTVPQMASVLRHGAAALRDRQGRLRGIIEASDTFVRNPRDEAMALYGTDDAAQPGVAYLLTRPTGLLGGRITVFPAPATNGYLRPYAPREVRALARREGWSGLAGLATAEGGGCLEPLGSSRPALLPIRRVAVRHSPGRDALLQAIVIKNHGAREVFLEYDRSDWLAVAQQLTPEDLGVTPIWMAGSGARLAVVSAESGPAMKGSPPFLASPHSPTTVSSRSGEWGVTSSGSSAISERGLSTAPDYWTGGRTASGTRPG